MDDLFRERSLNKFFGAIFIALACGAICVSAQQRTLNVDLLITGGTVVTMDGERHLYEGGFVAVRGAQIVAVGEARDAARYRANQTINARGKAVLPGLINAHTHVPMTLLRGIADDQVFQEWLEKYIFPAEAKNVTRDFVVAGTRLGLVEMLRGGITTYVDMYYFEDAIADETRRAGMRAVLGETVIDFPVPDNKTWAEALAYTETFVKKWKGDALITPAIAPHAPYTVSTAHLNEVRAFAEKHDVPIVMHIAEAPTETDYTLKNFGDRPVAYLEKIGFLSPRVLGAHLIQVNDAEIALLKQRDIGIAHCPQSNMKVVAGVAPVPQMLKANLRLGLGTDGTASNNDLNLWEEMDTAAKLHKLISRDATAVSAQEALAMATIGGARALHMEREIGSLEAGKRADVIVVDLSAAHQTPLYNPYSHLVYTTKASDVTDTIVNGRVLMRDRRLLTLNEQAIKLAARAYGRRVSRSLNLGGK